VAQQPPAAKVVAAVVAIARSGAAFSAKSGPSSRVIAAGEAPIAIFELTLKAADLPEQEVRDPI